MMNYYMPVQLFTGTHSVAEHAELFPRFGSRCLIVTGKTSAVRSGALQDMTDVLCRSSIAYRVFDGISQNPSLVSCMQAGELAVQCGAEFVIGIGGGSALDAAKACAVFAANPGLDEEAFYAKAWQAEPLPVLLVGTTSGTGSEVTKVSVLTDSRRRKHSIHDNRLFAKAAFGDPAYTAALPLPVTLSTGIDVLSHCAESYFNRKADELSRSFAVRGIRLLFGPLQAAAEGHALSLEQRAELYDASILGGLAICGTGTCFPHSVGYYLTENYGVPHGFASAAFLPDLLLLVKEKDAARTERFFCELGISENEMIRLVSACLPENRIAMTREEILSLLPRWENNSSVKNTCCAVGTAEIKSILEKKFLRLPQ